MRKGSNEVIKSSADNQTQVVWGLSGLSGELFTGDDSSSSLKLLQTSAQCSSVDDEGHSSSIFRIFYQLNKDELLSPE